MLERKGRDRRGRAGRHSEGARRVRSRERHRGLAAVLRAGGGAPAPLRGQSEGERIARGSGRHTRGSRRLTCLSDEACTGPTNGPSAGLKTAGNAPLVERSSVYV